MPTYETPPSTDLGFDMYQRQAHTTSLIDTLPDPISHLEFKTMEETMEVFFEDGHSRRFLALFGIQEPAPEEKAGITKEFGDILWYISEAATRGGQSLGSIAVEAVYRNAGITLETDSIASFDQVAAEHAATYAVINHKIARESGSTNRAYRETTLEENTGYVLQRVLTRMCVTFKADSMRYLLFSNVSLDPEEVISNSPGDALWVMAGTANLLLGTSLTEAASNNLAKIQRRKEAGTILSGADPERSTQ